MRKFISALVLCFLLCTVSGITQPVDKTKFFAEDKIVKATLVTNMSKVLSGKMKDGDSIPSSFTLKLSEAEGITENILLSVRGNFRRKNCIIPPLRVDFKKYKSSSYATLGSLKLVNACRTSDEYDQYILMEYLIYKMYNLFTEKSFRVRLLELTYKDTASKKKPVTQHAFLIEDTKDMARRNNMEEWKKWKVLTEQTDREHTTLVAVFEYMIGNTDWSVPVTHNIRLIYNKETQKDFPFAVPYDFDYSGLINAEYAVPSELLNIESVRQRLYRGFPREMDELTKTFQLFKDRKEKIYDLINNFELLHTSNKKEMIRYLDEFFTTIEDKKMVKDIFITNARKE
ncbi:MAG: hypothetical protein HYX40_13085 [Sphingobacteriales bacterium]|nr:hypothetical protein [Sphingobacteriales bacterium]